MSDGAPLHSQSGRDIFNRQNIAMKNHRDGESQTPFPSNGRFHAEENPDFNTGGGSRSPLPEGWRRLPTGLRGSRLYRVLRPGDAAAYWEAEVPLDSGRVQRRFASELHARVWLHLAAGPRLLPGSVDGDEINGSFRVGAAFAGDV